MVLGDCLEGLYLVGEFGLCIFWLVVFVVERWVGGLVVWLCRVLNCRSRVVVELLVVFSWSYGGIGYGWWLFGS